MSQIFKRVEKKYIINKKQYLSLIDLLKDKMVEDSHGKSSILNIYFDTRNYDLIMHSITKPIYKDKIRLRSYNTPGLNDKVFLEIKRKYKGIVSKRRISIMLKDFYKYLLSRKFKEPDEQIKREIDYYFKYYDLKEAMFLSYSREAFYLKEDKNFRITFDSNILARDYDLKLENGNYGTNILDKDKYILEVKTLGAMPLWFVKIINDLDIRPCGFSKYGEAYTNLILKKVSLTKNVI